MAAMFDENNQWMVRQKKEWVEIFTDFECKNQYEVLSTSGSVLGYVMERAGGFWSFLKRGFFRSHRSLDIDVYNQVKEPVLNFKRPFFWLFSTLHIRDVGGKEIGSVHRRFGIIYKKYDLRDERDNTFATIRSPLWRLWTFPIFDVHGTQEKGSISKRWGGGIREIFTDADAFMIDLSRSQFTEQQKRVAFAAAISIDFDFFENNQGSDGLLGFMGD